MIDEQMLITVLGSWPIGAVQHLRPASSGAINQTFLIDSMTGNYALRCYRKPNRERVAREHAIIRYTRSKGLPAIPPLQMEDGSTVCSHEGRFYALFPFARGQQVSDDELTEQHIRVMGAFLARLHRALHNYPHDQVSRREMTIDSQTTLATVDRCLAHIRALPSPQASDQAAQVRLEGQRAWVEQQQGASLDALATLPQQVIHGDYTHTNIFFEEGNVTAVIDWDQSYVAPRAWEVIRTVDLVLRFAPARTHLFVEAYRQVAPVSLAELDTAAHCYSLMRGFDTWMYEAIYDTGNDRVRAFIRPGGFVPIETQWATAREALI